jgi:HAD superfamily phosphatase (TIGR01668 family)
MLEIFKLVSYIPFECQNSVFDINYNKLYENGRKIILFDLDNTLIPYDVSVPNDSLKALFQSLKETGFKIMLISNNHKKRVKIFADEINCEYVYSCTKPLKRGYKKALRKLQHPNKHELIAIGDQLMTDLLGASRMKIDCILVKPIKRKSEKWFTKINRFVENYVLRKLYKKYPDIYQKIKELEE